MKEVSIITRIKINFHCDHPDLVPHDDFDVAEFDFKLNDLMDISLNQFLENKAKTFLGMYDNLVGIEILKLKINDEY